MAERTQFAGLFQDRRVRRDGFPLRPTQVAADLEYQGRHMIQQAVGRKNLARLHRQQVEQPLEPARGNPTMLAAHARGDEVTEVSDHSIHVELGRLPNSA